ncbi:SusD/RagB family nutrient-binding outer membrane lipoprotein [Pedobacter sp. BS3]|nr:SusD/RagB family nutrient-binding outer membrane lipoprotein [Pedobacter sp. BS3]
MNTGTSAETYYLQGIRSNFEFWGLTPSSTYLNGSGVAFDNTLEIIMKQKYLASFYRGLEAWFEYRRTGFPNLIIDPRADNNAVVPSRLVYPAVTQMYNPTNYRKAVERMGGDNINIKSFWEKP